MGEAEKLFNEAFARWLQASATVSNFRETFTAVASSATEHLELSATELFRKMHEDPQYRGILVDKTGEPASARPVSDYQKLGKTAAQVLFDTSYASLDAAAVVFYHSLLDALAFDCCRVTAIHAPRDWEQDLRNTQVQLLETQSKSYDQLLLGKLDERLDKLERESLLTKVDRLFARCNPPAGWSPMVGYAFDRDRIKRFDDQRHEIIHGTALGKPLTLFQISEDNLFYVTRTGMYLIGLINFKYGLQVDANSWSGSPKTGSGAA
jgi:hypothetical protein